MQTRTFAKLLRGKMTDAEWKLWFHLRAHRLKGHKFKRQQPIGPYIVDFVCFENRLIVELDGGQHAGCNKDLNRDAWLRLNDFRVLRFWNNDVLQKTDQVLETILMAIEGSPSPNSPLPLGERG
jgi:very-short-patch-repair endonuclease